MAWRKAADTGICVGQFVSRLPKLNLELQQLLVLWMTAPRSLTKLPCVLASLSNVLGRSVD
jgi:hypothetical protein